MLRTRLGEPVRDADLAEDERGLARALEDAGHADARVEASVSGEGLVTAVFRVERRARHAGGRGGGGGPRAAAGCGAQELRLRPGEPYRLRDVAADRAALALAYRNEGYLGVEVTPEVEAKDGEAHVRLVVTPGPRTIVDRVVVAGLDQTREEVVRRELQVREGEPLGADDLLETQRRLSALGLFEAVTHRRAGRRFAGAAHAGHPRGRGPAHLGGVRDRVRGAGPGPRQRRGHAAEPVRHGPPVVRLCAHELPRQPLPRLLPRALPGWGGGRSCSSPPFATRRTATPLTIPATASPCRPPAPLTRRWNLVLRQTYQEIRTYNVVEDCLALDRQYCPATLSGPSASVVSDTRDDPLDPRRGYFFLTDAQVSLRALGGDALLKGFVQASGYRLLAPRVILALAGRLGMGRTFGEEPLLMPIPERFFAGGDYSLRGFGVDEVRPEGGNGVLLGTAEVRIDTGGGFSAAAFTDVGNVYRLASEMTLSDLRYTAGVGLRYRSALGPLRLDWGYKLDRREGESASHLHVTIGHAF